MRAVKGSLGHSPEERNREIEIWEALVGRAQLGTNQATLTGTQEKEIAATCVPLHTVVVEDDTPPQLLIHLQKK